MKIITNSALGRVKLKDITYSSIYIALTAKSHHEKVSFDEARMLSNKVGFNLNKTIGICSIVSYYKIYEMQNINFSCRSVIKF